MADRILTDYAPTPSMLTEEGLAAILGIPQPFQAASGSITPQEEREFGSRNKTSNSDEAREQTYNLDLTVYLFRRAQWPSSTQGISFEFEIPETDLKTGVNDSFPNGGDPDDGKHIHEGITGSLGVKGQTFVFDYTVPALSGETGEPYSGWLPSVQGDTFYGGDGHRHPVSIEVSSKEHRHPIKTDSKDLTNQSFTGSYAAPPVPITITHTYPDGGHGHTSRFPKKKIIIGGKKPPTEKNVHWYKGPTIEIPGTVDFVPTGEAYVHVWRKGLYVGRFPAGTEVPYDENTPIIRQDIGVIDPGDYGFESAGNFSNETNTQLIPSLL